MALILLRHWGEVHQLTGWNYFVIVVYCLIQDDQVIYCLNEGTFEGERIVVTGKQ